MIRVLMALTLIVALTLGAGLYIAGNASGPEIEILQPTQLIGRSAVLEVLITTPGGNLTSLDSIIEQDGQRLALYSLDTPIEGEVRQDGPDRIRVTRRFNQTSHPELTGGTAQVIVSAARPILFGLREANTTTSLEVEVRVDPPRIQVVSDFHYINHGGSEMVAYRVSPPDTESGVQVGDQFYRGYPASGAGVPGDDTLRVAFFALLHDQDTRTPIKLYAADAAGNETIMPFNHRVLPTPFRRAQISLSDGFLHTVVPLIVERTPELADETIDASTSPKELSELYLFINRTLRQRNRETVAAFAGGTTAHLQWDGPFLQLANSQVESGFADHRTYFYDGNDIDQQVHLGFDLASTKNAPVSAANTGTVVYADYLGIYGNCVIIDHGMGLQSLYAHLSALDVTPGETVARAQRIGLSGRTGLAGGDHLHFAMLLQGHPVTPVEWWDPHWIEDRIKLKLRKITQPPGP
jgi:murein DD-endopeptidase MepM/ murein hydrolase activator NlpD